MNRTGRLGTRTLALATVAAVALAGGMALAQKPPPAGAPTAPQRQATPALPTAKPPPLGAPMQAQPAPTPTPPPVAQPMPRTPPPPPVTATPAVPANEPAAVTRLRGLLGRNVQLSYASAQALDPAGEQVRLTGVVLERPRRRATADEVTISGLRRDGVTEAVLVNAAMDDGRTQARVGRLRIAGLTLPPTQGGPPDPAQVRLEAVSVEGLQVSGEVTARLARASLENWIAGQPVRFAMEGLEVTNIDGGLVDGLRLARLSFGGFDLGATISAVMNERTPPSLVGRAHIDLDQLEMTGAGRPVGGMREMRIAADVTRADGSGTGTVALRGIRVEPMPMIGEWLTRFGYQAIDADLTADTSYDAASGRMELRDLTLAGRDVGTLSFSLNLDGLTQQRAQAADFEDVHLISMGLRYADASLFRRFLAMQAAQTRTTEAQLREQYAAMVGGALSRPGETGLDPIRNAVQRFIRGEAQTVEIGVNPPRPLRIGDLPSDPPNPADAQRMFGITAEAR